MTQAERDRALVTRPPRWVRLGVTLAFGAYVVSVLIWVIGALGWLPALRERFTTYALLVINIVGVCWSFANEEINRHYRRRAKRS